MDEYIRRQSAIDIVVFECGKWTGLAKEISKQLKQLPAADVAPVRHGEWISVPEIWGSFDIRYYCSKCGNDAIINNRERYVLSDYCPHCEAIMDNKRGNGND